MTPKTNAATTLELTEALTQVPAVCLPAGEGVAVADEVEDLLELVGAVLFVTRFVPVLTSEKNIRPGSQIRF
jgi:hypothetical protein